MKNYTKLGWSCEPASLPHHGLTELFLNKASAKWPSNQVEISFSFERPTKLRGLKISPTNPCLLSIYVDGEPHSGHELDGKETELLFQQESLCKNLKLTISTAADLEINYLQLGVAEEELTVMPDVMTPEEKLVAAVKAELTKLQTRADKQFAAIEQLTKDLNEALRDNLELGRENEKLKAQLATYVKP